MAAKSTVDILVSTTGNTSGVDKVNAALGTVEQAEKQLAAARNEEAKAAEAARVRAPLLAAGLQREREEVAKLIAAKKQAASEALQSEQIAANPWASASQDKSVIEKHTAWQQQMYSIRQQLAGQEQVQNKVAGSAQNLGTQVLYASRGLQDFQAAGMLGIANNLEQIAISMGLGAGVAGAATVLGVAVQTLGPSVVNWLKSLDTEGKKLNDLKEALGRAATAIKEGYTSNTDNAKTSSDNFREALKKEDDALADNTTALGSNVKLIKQRADLQKSDNQRKLDSDIEDIKAQNLPKDQEKAAIATRKREELNANKKLAEDAASADISAESGKVVAQQKRRDELKQQKKALEKEKAGAVEYAQLLEEQKKLEDQKRKADSEAARVETEVGYLPEAFKEAQNNANQKLDANRARKKELIQQAPEGRIRGVNEINQELDQVTPQAKEAEDQARKNLEALDAKIKEETQAQEFRDKEYKRNLDKIAREQTGGVYDQGNLNAPPAGLPGSPAPLGPPAAPGTTLPAPSPGFGPAELNPPRVPSTAPGPTFGPQPNAAESAPTSEKGSEKISAAAKKNADAFDRAAQMVEKLAEQTDKRLKAMEQKIRSQGVMA